MKTTILKLALGLTVAAVGALPASAGGDYGGGLKGLRGTYVPVPAPTPIPEYKAKYYLRTDLGVGFNLGSSVSESGGQYGVNDLGAYNNGGAPGTSFGLGDPGLFSSFGSTSGPDVGYSFGVGAGYYFNNNFRMDVTFDLREEKDPTINGQFTYTDTDAGGDVTGTVRDRFRLRSGIFMANAYYDVSSLGRFRPYVGGGIGFSVNEIERNNTTDYTFCPVGCITPTPAGQISRRNTDYTYSLAAQLTAGVSYEVWDDTHLDLSYRYLFVGGTDLGLSFNGSRSTASIDDQHEHYIRAGLRWDIN